MSEMREKVWDFLENSQRQSAKTVRFFFIALVLLSFSLLIDEYFPLFSEAWLSREDKSNSEAVIALIFGIEYCLRLWSSPNRRKFASSLEGIIDLLAFAPQLLLILMEVNFHSGALRFLRLLRISQSLKIFRYNNMKIRTKIFVAFLISMLLILLPMLYFVYNYVTTVKENDIKAALLGQVVVASRQFVDDDFYNLESENDPKYRKLQRKLQDIRDSLRDSGIDVSYVYTMKKHTEKSNTLVYLVDAEEGYKHSNHGSEFILDEKNALWMSDFSKPQSAPNFDYDDDGKTLVLSGLAPLPSQFATSRVIICIDILAEDVEKGKRVIGIAVILTLMASIIVVTLFSVGFAYAFNKPINELIKGIEAFEEQNYDYQVKVLTGDELGRVGELFNTKLFIMMRDFFQTGFN